jgi:acetyl-CoA carboxylase biotin carboxylase subunit
LTKNKPIMFKKILIANRGEIALQIIRACKELGIATVAVYSLSDKDSLPVKYADEAVCIGPANSASSYLHLPHIISAAEITGAEAIHPGYGFLAEDAHFAEVCEDCGIKFIGPRAETMRSLANKWEAKQIMQKSGLPVLPSNDCRITKLESAQKIAREIGYPIIIKAAAGGGGKGMRLVRDEEGLVNTFVTAQLEAQSAFGNSELYLEKYIEQARHIEFQILADQWGNIIHLGERECSIQRRHQKILEETPSPVVDSRLRQEMGKMAIKAAKATNYLNAGTVEFLLDNEGKYYFIEMNTRIQVEHPITELVTQINLIKEQIMIAAGTPLSKQQKDIRLMGHGIECRIYAEDPYTFSPSPGKITAFQPPGGHGVRVDTAVHADYVITPYYDPLIAKVIVHGQDRREAISKMLRALEEFTLEGVKTTIPLHLKTLRDDDFIQGKFYTDFLTRFFKQKP